MARCAANRCSWLAWGPRLRHRFVPGKHRMKRRQDGERRHTMSVRNNGKVVGALTLVAGGLIGAGIALLFAPNSGERTRREISLTARKAGRRVRREARDFSDNVSGLVDDLEHRAEEWREKGAEIAHDAKRGLRDTLEAGEEMLVRQKEKLAKIRG